MWLAHELDVLTAICTLIKIGGKGKRVHCSNKIGMQEPKNCVIYILGSKTESLYNLKKKCCKHTNLKTLALVYLFFPFLIIAVGV